jgi:menaquinone-dependent protoporphyrinogen oxidase
MIKKILAVVLGSAVYIGRWGKDAAKFLKANEKVLAEQLVWLFPTGPMSEGNPVELTEGWNFPKALQPIVERIRPRDIVVFHGVVT